MEIEPENVIYLFAFAALLFGGYGLILGKVTFFSGENSTTTHILIGVKARLVSIVFLLSSALLFSGSWYGYIVLAIALLLPWLLLAR